MLYKSPLIYYILQEFAILGFHFSKLDCSMNYNPFKWWYAIIGLIAFIISFILNSQFTSIIAPLFENTSFNAGGLLNISMFIFSGILCLLGFRLISKRMVTSKEFGIHLKRLGRTIIIGSILGLCYFIFCEIIELNSETLRKAGEEVMTEFNIGKNLLNDIFLLLGVGLFAPLVEEIIFRGGIFNPLFMGLKKIKSIPSYVSLSIAIAISSYLFMSIHGGGGQDAQLALLFVLGVIAALAMYFTKSLFGAILVHVVNNNLVFMYSLLKQDSLDTTHSIILIIVSIVCLFISIPLGLLFGRILGYKNLNNE